MKLFVGFDMQNSNIKVMNAEKPTESASVEYLHFTSRIFTDEFFEEAQKLLEECFAKKPSLLNLPAYVILPDQAVGFETFNLPNMQRAKMMQAMDAELSNLYETRYRNKKINRFVLAQNKQYTTVGAIYFDKKLIAQIYKLLTDVKVFPRQTTYSGNALMNCVYSFMPKTRGKSFVFADMHLDYTEIAISSKGKTLGVAVIPHGTSLIKSDKVELEYMRTDHEVGEIAVINAREVAKAKALTLSVDDEAAVDLSVIPEGATISDYAVDAAAQANEYSGTQAAARDGEGDDEEEEEQPSQGAAVPETGAAEEPDVRETDEDAASVRAAEADNASVLTAPASEEGEEPASDGEGAPDGGETPDGEGAEENSEFYESEEDEAKRLAEIARTKLKKTKVYRKMPKRYPKFMVRPTPETEEGFRYENFRIIMKWILLYARQAELSEYTSSPEFILVNMPPELYSLLDMANAEQKESGGLEFRPFSAADKLSAEIKGNLNLYGCLFAKHFNKIHNF